MKFRLTGMLVAGLVLLYCADRSRGDEPFRRTEDVVYGRKFGMALTMDVFQPTDTNGCALLFLVNGGWFSSKATPRMVTIRPEDYVVYLERGYTVFAVVTSSQPKSRLLTKSQTCSVRCDSFAPMPLGSASGATGWACWDRVRGAILRFPREPAATKETRRRMIPSSERVARYRPWPVSFRRPIS